MDLLELSSRSLFAPNIGVIVIGLIFTVLNFLLLAYAVALGIYLANKWAERKHLPKALSLLEPNNDKKG